MRFQQRYLDVGPREWWAREAMFLSSLVLAVGHIVVAYRTSCRERRKLLVYRIDLEAVRYCIIFCNLFHQVRLDRWHMRCM